MEPLNHDGEPLHTGDDERIDLVTSILAGCDECHDEDLDWSDVILGIREDCQKLDALLIQTIAREREREALLLQRAQEIAAKSDYAERMDALAEERAIEITRLKADAALVSRAPQQEQD